MCVAMPGKVIGLRGDHAVVDVAGNRMEVHVGVVSPKLGDYVLLHAGYAVEIVSLDEAKELEMLFGELAEAFDAQDS